VHPLHTLATPMDKNILTHFLLGHGIGIFQKTRLSSFTRYRGDTIQERGKHHNYVVTIIIRDMNASNYENPSFLTKLFEK